MARSGPRARRSAAAASGAALVALVLLPSAAGTTSAAWTDAAAFSAPVTAGTWTPTAPGAGAVVPGNADTTVTNLAWTVGPYVLHVCVAVTVTTSSDKPVEWRAQVDYTAAPFRGDTAMSHYVLEGDAGWVERLDDTPVAGQIQFRGKDATAPNDYRHLSADPSDGIPTSRTFTLCDRNLPDPQYDPAQVYEVTQTSAPPTNPYNACVAYRVAVTSPTYPFYVGWRADVDLGAAFALRRAAGLSATTAAVSSGGATAVRLAGDVYRVTSTQTYTSGVRSASGGDPAVTQAFTVCAG
jgi:hypothetical protein